MVQFFKFCLLFGNFIHEYCVFRSYTHSVPCLTLPRPPVHLLMLTSCLGSLCLSIIAQLVHHIFIQHRVAPTGEYVIYRRKHSWRNLTLPQQPSTASGSSDRDGESQPLPCPRWSGDCLDLVHTSFPTVTAALARECDSAVVFRRCFQQSSPAFVFTILLPLLLQCAMSLGWGRKCEINLPSRGKLSQLILP